MKLPESQSGCWFPWLYAVAETGMISRWLSHANASVFWTHTDSPVSVRWKKCAASLVTPRPGSSPSSGAQKNDLQGMWSSARGLVRPQDPAGARPVLRRHASLSGDRDSAGSMPKLRQGEARASRLSCRQPPLYKAVCLVCGPALPGEHHSGCRQGTAPGLAYRQGVGQAVHGSPAGAGRHAGAQGNRYRRNLDSQGPHLSHRGERPDPGPAHLVRRRGSLGGQHEPIL